MTADPVLVALRVVEILERIGVDYLIGGSVASSVLGEPRATEDADIIADIHMEHADDLVTALELEFYVDAEAVRDAIRRRSSFNVIHLERMQKVDVFVLSDRAEDREEMARRQKRLLVTNPDRQAYLPSPEDLVLQKLRWFHEGGRVSDRQWRDALGILKVQSQNLDLGYLRGWGRKMGVDDLLERILEEAGLPRRQP